MPAINAANPLVKIINMGLLDQKVLPQTGKEGALDYGLTGRDVSALAQTCRDAHQHLKMTRASEVNHLVRVGTMLREQQPTAQGVRNARRFADYMQDHSSIVPRRIYNALAEMSLLGTTVLRMQSTPEERRVALIFAIIMHARTGAMAHAPNVVVWVDRMRTYETAVYRDFLRRSSTSISHDAAALGLGVGTVAGSYLFVANAARVAACGSGAGKVAAVLTMPLWPFAAAHAVTMSVACAPLAVGVACVGVDLGLEALSATQTNYYKDAVLYDMALNPSTILLEDHSDAEHFEFYDSREPRQAADVGERHISRWLAYLFWPGVY